MGYPLQKILASLPPGPRPPIFIGVAEPLNEAENCIAEKGAIVLTERNIGKSRIDQRQTKA